MNLWLLSESESLELILSLMLLPTVSQSWNKALIWGLRPDLHYCQTVAGLMIWGALSDEPTGLPFTIASGPRQRSHSWVRVLWDSRPYFTVSDSRLPFSSPPTTRIATVEVFYSLWKPLSRDVSRQWGSCLHESTGFYNYHVGLTEVTMSKGSTATFHECFVSETCMNGCLAKQIIPCLVPLFRLLGNVYRALLSNRLFQLVFPETCFNKPLTSNGFRHNIYFISEFSLYYVGQLSEWIYRVACWNTAMNNLSRNSDNFSSNNLT
jgi:hypothetical protein